MGDTFAFRELAFGGMDISKKLELGHEPIVLAHIHDDRGTVAPSGEDEGPLGLSNSFDQCRRVGAELGDRLDVVSGCGRFMETS